MTLAARNCLDMTKHSYCEEAVIGWRRAGGFLTGGSFTGGFLNRLTG